VWTASVAEYRGEEEEHRPEDPEGGPRLHHAPEFGTSTLAPYGNVLRRSLRELREREVALPDDPAGGRKGEEEDRDRGEQDVERDGGAVDRTVVPEEDRRPLRDGPEHT